MEMSDRDYGLRVKVIGHQWYWSYEYRYNLDLEEHGLVKEIRGECDPSSHLSYDSYMLTLEDLEDKALSGDEGSYRLLEVDNRLVCPTGANVRILVSSDDVIHC